jgi:hypothetical protein
VPNTHPLARPLARLTHSPRVPPPPLPPFASASTQLLTGGQLMSAQAEAVARVRGVLGEATVSGSTARALLIRFHWHLDNLFACLADGGPDALLAKVGAGQGGGQGGAGGEAVSATLLGGGPGGSTTAFACPVCLCDVPRYQCTLQPGCGHGACDACWAAHLVVQVTQAAGAATLRCVAFRCATPCDEATVARLLTDNPEVLARCVRLLTGRQPSVPACLPARVLTHAHAHAHVMLCAPGTSAPWWTAT